MKLQSFKNLRSTVYFIKQSVNIPATKKFFNLIFQPKLFIPQQYVKTINNVDIDSLKRMGIKYIVFDKDQTLTSTYSSDYHSKISILPFQESFGEKNLAILSNSVGSNNDENFEEAIQTELKMKISVIRHLKKKPDCLQEVLTHFRDKSVNNNDDTNIHTRQICVIGDRVLTDVVFANLHGMYSVLVEPLDCKSDHPISIFFR